MKTMEKLMERPTMDNIPPPRENHEEKNRNQNVRRPQVLQNRKRDHRNSPEPPVRPPFQENYVENDYENQVEDEIYQLDNELSSTFFTKEDNDNSCQEVGELPAKETEEFKKGYPLEEFSTQNGPPKKN